VNSPAGDDPTTIFDLHVVSKASSSASASKRDDAKTM